MNRISRGLPRWLIPGTAAVSLLVVAVAIVLLLVVAVAAMPQIRAIGSDGSSQGEGSATVTRPIQINKVEVRIAESYPAQVFADVSGTIPDSCTTALDPVVTEAGSTITVEILGERPEDAMCAQVISEYQENISLGSFEPGDYILIVNDQKTPFHVD